MATPTMSTSPPDTPITIRRRSVTSVSVSAALRRSVSFTFILCQPVGPGQCSKSLAAKSLTLEPASSPTLSFARRDETHALQSKIMFVVRREVIVCAVHCVTNRSAAAQEF